MIPTDDDDPRRRRGEVGARPGARRVRGPGPAGRRGHARPGRARRGRRATSPTSSSSTCRSATWAASRSRSTCGSRSRAAGSPHATILLLLDREADKFLAPRADVDLMLVKPVDAGVLRRAAKQLLAAARRVDDEPRRLSGRPRARRGHRAREPASSSSSCSAARRHRATKATASGNDLILAAPRASTRPDDAILSEESKDDPVRLERGTRVDRRSRSTARASSAKPAAPTGRCTSRSSSTACPSRGAVALPAQDLVLSTATPPPALAPPTAGPIRLLVVAHPAAGARRRTSPTCSTPSWCRWARPARRRWRSCSGDADVYAHGGGQYEWDSAAPVGVATAAGCHCSRLDGSPLRLQPARPVPARPARVPPRARRRRCSTPSRRAPSAARTRAEAPDREADRYTAQAPTGCGAAWLARSVRDAEAPGSNPGTPTTYNLVTVLSPAVAAGFHRSIARPSRGRTCASPVGTSTTRSR